MSGSFPRLHARTRRFSLGRPRAFTVRDDGVVLFLRSAAGDDPSMSLWRRDLDGTERVLVDAAGLDADDAGLPPEERARRERAREQAGGIVAYTTDRAARRAAFAVGGRLHVVDTDDATTIELDADGVFAPVIDPTGARVCWVAGGALWVGDADPVEHAPVRLCHEHAPTITWGAAEFVAAEEMGRMRGSWWSPDGRRLAVARVDTAPVQRWRISDPSDPGGAPVEHRYPPAGGENAEVTLHVVDLDGERVEVQWDRDAFEYLAAVRWDEVDGHAAGRLSLLVQSRDQRTVRLLVADPDSGATDVVDEVTDDAWVSLVPGTPAFSGHDEVLVVPDVRGEHGTSALRVGGRTVSPGGLQVRSVLRADADAVWFTASGDDPWDVAVWCWRRDRGDGEEDVRPASPAEGVHGAAVGRTARVEVRSRLGAPSTAAVQRVDASSERDGVGEDRAGDGGPVVEGPIRSLALDPGVEPRPRLLRLGPRRCPAALLLPRDDDGTGSLPVLMDPYGGPGHGRVVRSREAHLTSQWLADQGFAVLVVDNRGSPGVGPVWERAIHRDLATPVLDDQVDALHAAAELEPRLDLARVAMRGWSFGGFLAALAVLRRPDVFRAGIAGAPVTDWHLYDTHYTERYLGRPATDPGAYAVSSVVDAEGTLLGAAEVPDPSRPPRLLLVHGLADDNVVAAHALRLSAALLAAGRPHEFLPLTGVTHMTPQEVVAENLLRLQVDFLRRALIPAGPRRSSSSMPAGGR